MKDFFTCRDCVNLLTDYLEGNLDTASHQKLDDHFKACAPCVNFFKTYRVSSELTQKLREQDVNIPVEVQIKLKAFLKKELH